jgi:hypothetical protein
LHYSGYLVPTNADILELDVLILEDFDEEANPLGWFVSRRRLLWIIRNDDNAAVTPSVVELSALPAICAI